jgi:hypothetical protein
MRNTSNLTPLVDELGHIKAQMANLVMREKALKTQLIDAGVGAYEGDDYRASVSHSVRETLDMDAVREKLTPQFIAAHTRATDVFSVRVSARNGNLQ